MGLRALEVVSAGRAASDGIRRLLPDRHCANGRLLGPRGRGHDWRERRATCRSGSGRRSWRLVVFNFSLFSVAGPGGVGAASTARLTPREGHRIRRPHRVGRETVGARDRASDAVAPRSHVLRNLPTRHGTPLTNRRPMSLRDIDSHAARPTLHRVHRSGVTATVPVIDDGGKDTRGNPRGETPRISSDRTIQNRAPRALRERAPRASHANGARPSKRRARARVGESEGRRSYEREMGTCYVEFGLESGRPKELNDDAETPSGRVYGKRDGLVYGAGAVGEPLGAGVWAGLGRAESAADDPRGRRDGVAPGARRRAGALGSGGDRPGAELL